MHVCERVNVIVLIVWNFLNDYHFQHRNSISHKIDDFFYLINRLVFVFHCIWLLAFDKSKSTVNLIRYE